MDIRTENMTLNKDFLFLLVNFNPLQSSVAYLYPLKTSENL